jgi:amino acid transporter
MLALNGTYHNPPHALLLLLCLLSSSPAWLYPMNRAEWIIAFGALVGLTSVLVISLIGQPRILMSMARDGLIPEQFFAAIHPK